MGDAAARLTFLIPALNEAATIAHVIAEAKKHDAVDQIIVVDNNSSDDTGAIARNMGAEVVLCRDRGLGYAMKAGFAAARNRWVFKADGDMRNFDVAWIEKMLKAVSDGVGMVKSYWHHEIEGWPETYFLIKPMLRRIDPQLAAVSMPISGIYLLDASLLEPKILANDWAIDLDLVYRIHQQGGRIAEVELPIVQHNERPLSAYYDMADELLAYLLRISRRHARRHMLLVMAHADDAEIWSGGALLNHLLDGGSADLIIASAEGERRAEADMLSRQFRALEIHCGDALEAGAAESGAVRDLIERSVLASPPFAVITHAPSDPHPDHVASAIATHAALMRLSQADAPARLFYCNGYFGGNLHHGGFEPDTFVDISNVADAKYAAIRNHASQDPEFWVKMADSMDILNGMRCGARRAEAFRRSPHPFFQARERMLF